MNKKISLIIGVLAVIIICQACVIAGLVGKMLFLDDKNSATEKSDDENSVTGKNKSTKPPHYGVFIKQNGDLLELDEGGYIGVPDEDEVKNAEDISDSKPVIVYWRANVNLNYLGFYKLGTNMSRREEVKFQTVPIENGVYEITPASTLKDGIYCLIQGDPLEAYLPGWCFEKK